MLLGKLTYCTHHHKRTDGDYFIVLVAGFKFFLQSVGNKALNTVRTIIGSNNQPV